MRMQQRRKTAATWTTSNEQLLDGELGVESDTGKWKIGDGTTPWTALAYQPSNTGISTAISTAVANLVNGAPGAVDTLKELADALGDDPNFATTVTNALAAKANSASLGTAATHPATDFDLAGAAATAQTYAIQRSNHTGTQPASTVTGLAAVATSGAYGDLTGTVKTNFAATTDPTVTSDSSAGYGIGSRWVNTSSKTHYACLDATAGAAVWQRLTADVQTFTVSGTWTKPVWASTVLVAVVAGGSGGGGGRRGASGTASSGGSGGGGGGVSSATFPVGVLSATETVTVGTGGAGGAAATADNGNGGNGAAGTLSSFGTRLKAISGGNGGGGLSAAGQAGGSAGIGNAGSATAGGASTSGAAGTLSGTAVAAAGGGGGGGITATPTFTAGGTGGGLNAAVVTAAPGGLTDGAAGTAGTTPASGSATPGGGGGGGASSITGVGGNGGAGGSYGAGGGGGGASLNGFNSGAGGAGAPGIVVVITR